MSKYKHLDEVRMTEKAVEALRDCAQWLQNAHFQSLGSCELCDKAETLQRKTLDFLIEMGKDWANVRITIYNPTCVSASLIY